MKESFGDQITYQDSMIMYHNSTNSYQEAITYALANFQIQNGGNLISSYGHITDMSIFTLSFTSPDDTERGGELMIASSDEFIGTRDFHYNYPFTLKVLIKSEKPYPSTDIAINEFHPESRFSAGEVVIESFSDYECGNLVPMDSFSQETSPPPIFQPGKMIKHSYVCNKQYALCADISSSFKFP